MSKDQYITNIDYSKSWRLRVEQARGLIHEEKIKDYACSYLKLDVVTIDGVEKLIKKRASEDDPMLFFIPNEDLFDTIQEVHVSHGHAGITKLMVLLKKKYANITRECARECLSYCDKCVSEGYY